MDESKDEYVLPVQPKQEPSTRYFPLFIFHNQAMATSLACVNCDRIASKCYTNEESAEILCPGCAQKAIQNDIKCTLSHTIQKMINNLQIKCMNNNEKILNSDENDEGTEGDNSGISVCAWEGKLVNWATHSENECSLSMVECPYKRYGCVFAAENNNNNNRKCMYLTKDELEQHMRENGTKHILLQMKNEMHLLNKIQKLEERLLNTETEVKTLTLRLTKLEKSEDINNGITCYNGHILSLIDVELLVTSNPGYVSGYKCNRCKVSRDVLGNNGKLYHCRKCCFDLCIDCYSILEKRNKN